MWECPPRRYEIAIEAHLILISVSTVSSNTDITLRLVNLLLMGK